MIRIPRPTRGLVGALALLAGLLWTGEVSARSGFRRFALVVGANDGGKGRTRLRYAHSDARAMARVLRQLGGVKRADLIVLLNPKKMTLLGGLYKLRTKLKAARKPGVRVEAIFYYSGHSDETGLLLRGERFRYKAIRTAIGDFPADLRIAVLDSCASGALTRLKGGRRRPPFMVDRSSDVRGRAFLTSASASEGAQESDRIKGSYFTHYLVSGLRGAADRNRDGKVTLTEAYQYAFHQTLKRTQSSRAGPQHANYDFQLTGSGDLVLTDLRRISARLLLASRMHGRLYIRDRRGRLVAEVAKQAGKPLTIGLAAGRYTVLLTQGSKRYKHRLVLRKSGRVILTRAQMSVATASDAVVLRGSGAPGVERRHRAYRVVPVNVGVLPYVDVNALFGGVTKNYFSFSFGCGLGHALSGFDFAAACSIWRDDVRAIQVAGGFSHVGGRLSGIQVTGAYAGAAGGVQGLQLTGGLALAGPLRGVQVAGAVSLASGDAIGLQLAGGVNVARRMSGLQVAGGANVAWAGLSGLAVGAVNVHLGPVKGVQVGAVDVAGELRGLQVSAVNVATGGMKGFQLGAANFARRASGLQLGVINVAEEGDGLVPIGLVNYVGNGLLQPTFWTTGGSVGNVGVKMGSKTFYGLVGVGVQPTSYTPEGASAAVRTRHLNTIFGLGTHIATRWWRMYVDVDVVANMMLGGDQLKLGHQNWLNQLRVMVGFRIIRQLSIYAGPSLDLMISEDLKDVGIGTANLWTSEHDDSSGTRGVNKRLGLSFVLGLQYEPRFGKMNKLW